MPVPTPQNGRVRAGSLADLVGDGRLTVKVGSLPVVVVRDGDRCYAIEDRCPHLGFPLRQGTVESGLITCHWHHARFDLASGCTLDPWADDAKGFDVVVEGDDVLVAARPDLDPAGRLRRRLREGLEQGLTLVSAKAVLGLLELEGPQGIVATALEFGSVYRESGWGAGLTVLVAMAGVLDQLDEEDRALALVHALAFVSRDTAGQPPRFPVEPLTSAALAPDRLETWYRRFVETRSSDAAERVVATAARGSATRADVEAMMFAAVTDHVFLDEGHTLDFTNKAFEALHLVPRADTPTLLTSLVSQTCRADRAEESAEWRHPHDLRSLAAQAEAELPEAMAAGAKLADARVDVGALGWALLDDDPEVVIDAVLDAARAGATPEQLGRALAYAAALRITRFHVQNDFGDWNTVHHSFTTSNGLHQALVRRPTPALLRGLVHGALRVYLDRFLNVPAARLPDARSGDLADLAECWEVQGDVDRAGSIAYGFLAGGGDRRRLIAALGHAVVQEDAGFHWFQVFEAGVRQSTAWPEGSQESALILTGVARFVAAHTPTRRELPTVVRTATRLRRGENVFEEPLTG
jgi:nitrite reductase/ring-hydroxylating ferredoxin subunit